MTKTKNLQEKHKRLRESLQPKEVSHQHLPSIKTMTWRASTDMIGGIVVGTGSGLLFDRLLHTPHWGLIIGFLLGSAAGLLNVYRSLCKVGYGFGNNKET